MTVSSKWIHNRWVQELKIMKLHYTHVEHIQCRGIWSFEVELTLALNSIKLDYVSVADVQVSVEERDVPVVSFINSRLTMLGLYLWWSLFSYYLFYFYFYFFFVFVFFFFLTWLNSKFIVKQPYTNSLGDRVTQSYVTLI